MSIPFNPLTEIVKTIKAQEKFNWDFWQKVYADGLKAGIYKEPPANGIELICYNESGPVLENYFDVDIKGTFPKVTLVSIS